MRNRPATTNRSLRLDTSLVEELQRQALARGQSANALAERLIAEGLRQNEHPLIAFREGAGGRRAAVVGTRLDVWQVIDTVRASDNSIAAAAMYLDVPEAGVQAAIRYYAAYGQEVDDFGARAKAAAERERELWERQQAVLA